MRQEKIPRMVMGWMALCLCVVMGGCSVDMDPPEINALPHYDDKEEMDSGDFQDNLVYGEYNYASYTPQEMETYLQSSTLFAPATGEDKDLFLAIVQHFEGRLSSIGANEEFAAQYYTDEDQLSGRLGDIECDESDWFAHSAYGYFWYDTETQTVFHYNL